MITTTATTKSQSVYRYNVWYNQTASSKHLKNVTFDKLKFDDLQSGTPICFNISTIFRYFCSKNYTKCTTTGNVFIEICLEFSVKNFACLIEELNDISVFVS